ncbi:MAG: hypothetical protein LBS50_00750 [Prevotellaceae bacterium]|jgi:hypothetical protein|nr:hypothetical protein [Prevotellaceae bacterium]
MSKGKNLIKIAILTLLIINTLTAQSQVYQNKYYLSFWGAGGYASILHKEVPYIQAKGGIGGLLGLGFEYNHKRFVITTGVEFDFKRSTSKYEDFAIYVGSIIDDGTGLEVPLHDNPNWYKDISLGGYPFVGQPVINTNGVHMVNEEGDPFIMKYDFHGNKDVYNAGYINIPLLMGAKFDNGFYFLVGGKFGLNMFVNGFTNAPDYSTSAIYPQLHDWFSGMYNHSLGDHLSTKDLKVDFRWGYNIAASAEIGKTFFPNKKTRWHYRIALFADYGIMSVNLPGNISMQNTDGNFTGIQPGGNESNPMFVRLNPILTSYQAFENDNPNIPHSINPLLVGVKFTFLFDLGNKEPCVCLPEYKSKWTKGGRQRTSYIKTYKTPSGAKQYKK